MFLQLFSTAKQSYYGNKDWSRSEKGSFALIFWLWLHSVRRENWNDIKNFDYKTKIYLDSEEYRIAICACSMKKEQRQNLISNERVEVKLLSLKEYPDQVDQKRTEGVALMEKMQKSEIYVITKFYREKINKIKIIIKHYIHSNLCGTFFYLFFVLLLCFLFLHFYL